MGMSGVMQGIAHRSGSGRLFGFAVTARQSWKRVFDEAKSSRQRLQQRDIFLQTNHRKLECYASSSADFNWTSGRPVVDGSVSGYATVGAR